MPKRGVPHSVSVCACVCVCVCECGPERDAKKQYSLITEQMDNTSAFDLFVFRKREQQSCGKTNEVKRSRVFH